jgi:hypothetical protein
LSASKSSLAGTHRQKHQRPIKSSATPSNGQGYPPHNPPRSLPSQPISYSMWPATTSYNYRLVLHQRLCCRATAVRRYGALPWCEGMGTSQHHYVKTSQQTGPLQLLTQPDPGKPQLFVWPCCRAEAYQILNSHSRIWSFYINEHGQLPKLDSGSHRSDRRQELT